MSVHVLNTILMPQLEMAGRMVNFTQLDLNKWNSELIESALRAHGALGRDTLSRVAVNQVTGLSHPRDVINTARVMDLASRLTSPHRPDSKTLWARLRAAVGRRKSSDEILKAIGLTDLPCPRNNRVMKTFQFMKGMGMRAEFFPNPWWSNELQLVEEETWTGPAWEDEQWHPHFSRYRLLRGSESGAVDAFTDEFDCTWIYEAEWLWCSGSASRQVGSDESRVLWQLQSERE